MNSKKFWRKPTKMYITFNTFKNLGRPLPDPLKNMWNQFLLLTLTWNTHSFHSLCPPLLSMCMEAGPNQDTWKAIFLFPWQKFRQKDIKRNGMGMKKPVYPSPCVLSHFSCVWLCDPMDCSRQAPLSTGFSRQESWRGWPCPSPGDLPDPGTEPASLMFLEVAGGFFTTSTTWKVHIIYAKYYNGDYLVSHFSHVNNILCNPVFSMMKFWIHFPHRNVITDDYMFHINLQSELCSG